MGRHRAPLGHPRRLAEVFDAGVGARADEHLVDLDLPERRAGRQAHVVERAFHRPPPALVGLVGGVGDAAGDRQHVLGAGAPGHLRRDFGGVERDFGVVARARVAGQCAPVGDGLLPRLALGRERPALDVFERRLVGRDQPGARARLDRHVAHRHAPFHRQRPHRRPGVFDDVAGAPGGADPADDRQDQVLGGDAERGLADDVDAHVPRALLDQRLGGEHVLDFRGADADGERAERPVRRGVAVAADDRHAGLGQSLLGADDVDDALARVVHREQANAELGAVLLEGLDLEARFGLLDALRAVGGGHVVVGHRERRLGPAHLAAGGAQAVERLRAGDLVHQVAVDVQQADAVVLLVDEVALPDLVVQGTGLGHGSVTPCGTGVGTPHRATTWI